LGPIFSLVLGWAGLSQSADGLRWIGSHKMDPWTTLASRPKFCGLSLGLEAAGLVLGLGLATAGLDYNTGILRIV